jgi:hypothetical protein
MLEIPGHWQNHKSDTCSKADGQGKIYFAEGCTSNQSQASKHTKQEVHSVFISNTSLSLTLMDGFGFTIFMTGYLEKGVHGIRGTLKQGEQENSFG